MAIEFDCPYCTATIRVPDAYGGKQGRCPKCDTHLMVPMVVRPGSPTVPDLAAAGGVVPAIANESNSQTEELFFNQIPPPKPTVRRRRSRRRPSRALVIGMPVVGFLTLVAILFYSLTGTLPLAGEFAAKPLEEKSLPRVTIPWSDTGLSPDEQKVLQESLRTTPETLASQIMTCRLIGADSGIEVQLTAGPENDWYVVTPSSAPLAMWLKKERSALNIRRVAAMRAALTSYCREKLDQIAGEPIAIDLVAVRDHVVFDACGGPFSSVIQAVAGNLITPCAYEDAQGAVYFCLPKGTQSFQITGRTLPDNSKPFNGEYKAIVTPSALTTPSTPASEKNNDSDMSKSEEMTPDSATESETMSNGDEMEGEEMEGEMNGGMNKKPKSESK